MNSKAQVLCSRMSVVKISPNPPGTQCLLLEAKTYLVLDIYENAMEHQQREQVCFFSSAAK